MIYTTSKRGTVDCPTEVAGNGIVNAETTKELRITDESSLD